MVCFRDSFSREYESQQFGSLSKSYEDHHYELSASPSVSQYMLSNGAGAACLSNFVRIPEPSQIPEEEPISDIEDYGDEDDDGFAKSFDTSKLSAVDQGINIWF